MDATVKSGESAEDRLSFRFIASHPALDFTATFGDRHRNGIERLREAADLDRWLQAAGMATSSTATRRHLDEARQLREVIYRLAHATLQGSTLEAGDLNALNAWARKPRLAPQLHTSLQRSWASPEPIHGSLALLASETIELLSGPDRQLIRECAAPACSLLYLDRSHGRRRRWCEMQRCGSRAKMAEYRKRARQSNSTRRPLAGQ